MLIDDSYHTISSPAEGIYKERGSRFIGLAFPISSADEVKAYLKEIKKAHHQANHHCYAFRSGPDGSVSRFSDDREPSGTAGKPILGQLQSAGLTDVLIIVARYFGGSLLGVPGLINAYRSSAKDAIDHATIIQKFVMVNFRITFGFQNQNELITLLKSYSAIILKQDLSNDCFIDFQIRRGKADELTGKIKNIYHSNNHILVSLLPVSN